MASTPIGGALPAQMPPSAGSIPKGDKAIARQTASKLLAATKGTHDPVLKATFSKALADVSTYLAQDTKEAKQGQARKVTPKVRDAKPAKRKA